MALALIGVFGLKGSGAANAIPAAHIPTTGSATFAAARIHFGHSTSIVIFIGSPFS